MAVDKEAREVIDLVNKKIQELESKIKTMLKDIAVLKQESMFEMSARSQLPPRR